MTCFVRRALCSVLVPCFVLVLVVALGALSTARAQGGMPDPSQMSGVPLPSPDLAAGTITVRVVRGSLANNIEGQTVSLAVEGGRAREATTDAAGRAEFTGLAAGQQVQASTVVDGTRLESQRITMPSQGGIRVMLFAPQDASARAELPNSRTAAPGLVVLGGETRFIVEHGDEALNVFYILEIVNAARAPIDAGGPLLFDLPSGATGATLLTGSTPQATVGGSRVTVTGPFAPGKTSLQIAYSLPVRGPRVTIEQEMPAAVPQVAVAGETTGGVTMTSPQFAASRDMNAEGRTFMVGNGPGLPAGGTLRLTFDNLPHHARWPRFAAFGVAVAIMVIGLVIGFAGRGPVDQARTPADALLQAREARFADLDALEARREAGLAADAEYRDERARILAALEDVYAAIDEQRT